MKPSAADNNKTTKEEGGEGFSCFLSNLFHKTSQKTTRLRGEKENWKIWEGCVYKLGGIKLKRKRGI